MAKKVIVNGLNIGYLPPTTADEILYAGGGNITIKDKIDSFPQYSGVITLYGNPDYFGSSENRLYYVKIGQIVVYTGRITLTSQKPAGQPYYLFKDLPIPYGIAGCGYGDEFLFIVNGDGYFTSNLATPAQTYNITGCYLSLN